ncbi:hypothetical protein SAMN05880590_102780 [Rhizobium sp. RU35A]|uniref:hypothetical protein n=1 Tax=Rhizobium sp. RU35A TaxID=1907414 RepID=UPI00095718E6|nr:hypothetical protein [Rhizobium sp. RU35A]SIQ24722.1 hypothetical protein SAMN05880590_102780 [Rhizobium sp. RU35A]
MWSGQPAVLAFAIRRRVTPTGRASISSIKPRLTDRTGRSTPSTFPILTGNPMTKRHGKSDTQNPFIPAASPICRAADTALLFSVALFGLAAAVAALLRQVLS